MGRDRLFSILRERRLLVARKRAYHKTTESHHRFRRHPNLLKPGPDQVVPSGPEQVCRPLGSPSPRLASGLFHGKCLVDYQPAIHGLLADIIEGPLKQTDLFPAQGLLQLCPLCGKAQHALSLVILCSQALHQVHFD
ncbi:insertion element, IS3 family protein [Stutzerimonas stutzeri NF13]|uniref:Insertion element, IS3 family protein n=1 Tax=Stutzerimonas stutzeri NF13 TaxID=1212548 RepID=M2VRH1_STUST|nr:insertion element, IS3 family protein [Stutzerimonas stutzeri NF13]